MDGDNRITRNSEIRPIVRQFIDTEASGKNREIQIEKIGHTVSNELPGEKKALAAFIAFLALPIIIAVGLVKLLSIPFHEFYKAVTDRPLQKAVGEAQFAEEKNKFQAMRKALQNSPQGKASKIISPADFAGKLTENLDAQLAAPTEAINRKFNRSIDRLAANATNLNKENVQKLFEHTLPSILRFKPTTSQDFHELLEQRFNPSYQLLAKQGFDWPRFVAELEAIHHPQEASATLHREITGLIEAINEKPAEDTDGLRAQNTAVTEKLRAALRSEAYQALKEDIGNPSVRLLHELSAAIWNKPEAFQGFQNLGKALLSATQTEHTEEEIKVAGSKGISSQQVIHDIESSLDSAKSQLFNYNGVFDKVQYAWFNNKQALASIRSQGGLSGEIAGYYGSGVYDSAKLSNNPSRQGTTEVLHKAVKAQINNVYGGVPTIDDAVAPEYLAIVQAAENNQLNPDRRIPSVPDFITYTNLQKIDQRGGEGPRSGALMRLNHQFPLSFRGITLTKDSEFFKRPCKSKDQWGDAEKFGNRMKEELLRPWDNVEGHGYYFPGTRSEWEPVFNQAIQLANAHFKDKKAETTEQANELGHAYQEFVQGLLRDYVEMSASQKLVQAGLPEPRVMAQCACKENIDRGGTDNIKFLYNRSHVVGNASTNQIRECLIGGLHGRPLLFRNRTILEHRVEPFLDYAKHVTPADYAKAHEAMIGPLGTYQLAGVQD